MADDSVIPPDVLARAEAALSNIAERYIEWAMADLARLEAAMEEARTGRASLDRLFPIAHDMKGQAGTFGYPLVTEIANRLCRLIDSDPRPDAAKQDTAAALVSAIGKVLRARLEGDGGEAGRHILNCLE